MRTLRWSYVGWRRSPRELSAFEVRRCFSLAPEDRQLVRAELAIDSEPLECLRHRMSNATSVTFPAVWTRYKSALTEFGTPFGDACSGAQSLNYVGSSVMRPAGSALART